MAKGIYITTKGLGKILQKMETFPEQLQKEVNREFQAAAGEVHREAVQNAPADEGGLRLSITNGKRGGNYVVSVQKRYAAYQEFGTKRNFRPTRGFERYASQFRGASGSTGNPIDALQGWVKRKGLVKGTRGKKTNRANQERQVAFLIYRKIKAEGVKARPYLFPAFVRVRRQLTPRIAAALRRSLK